MKRSASLLATPICKCDKSVACYPSIKKVRRGRFNYLDRSCHDYSLKMRISKTVSKLLNTIHIKIRGQLGRQPTDQG